MVSCILLNFFLCKRLLLKYQKRKIQRIVYLCKSMKICTRLSVAVLFPVLCIIMFFIEHLAQRCIAKTNVQLRFRFFVFDSFYSCFNSQCTLETTSLEISVYCPILYTAISSMFHFELLLKGLMDFFDAHTKFR